ncbi:MAG: amidohydrolase family protein, partial [Actinobacteria bacterium]|nr:amidohydrolase family protein [Actinomycetota bacterium]
MRDGRIVFVGSNADAESLRGPATRVVEVDGATVLPGLVDSHVHVAGLGEAAFRVDLTGGETEAEAVARVVEHAASVPAGQWIVGRGWDEGAWANRYPTLELISKKVPDHPVVLDSLHGFAVWGNRLAFDLAGIDRDTVDPDGGQIVRDANGDPTGILLNRARKLIDA